MSEKHILDPIIPWVGGKRWLREKVAIAYRKSKAEHYLEPFGGGLACAFEVDTDNVIVNDINSHLVNMYKQIAGGNLKVDKSDFDNYCYIRNRDALNEMIKSTDMNSPEAAKIFYLVMRKAFNGLCRYNGLGEFNSSEGDKKLHLQYDFSEHEKEFKKWRFESKDVCSLDVPQSTFIFFDSPYDDVFSGYWKDKFTKDDFIRSLEWAVNTNQPILLTNKNTDFVLKTLKSYGFKYMVIEKRYSVSGVSKGRTKTNEVVAWKNMRKPF